MVNGRLSLKNFEFQSSFLSDLASIIDCVNNKYRHLIKIGKVEYKKNVHVRS